MYVRYVLVQYAAVCYYRRLCACAWSSCSGKKKQKPVLILFSVLSSFTVMNIFLDVVEIYFFDIYFDTPPT
jgi:hypothetical protein